MTFTDELESKIQSIYLAVLNKRHITYRNGKTLTCNSFRIIAEEIKSVLIDGTAKGLGVTDISNNIINRILNCKYFIYENHEMAALIGYYYLKRQGVNVKNYSLDGLNNNSTLEQIAAITGTWL